MCVIMDTVEMKTTNQATYSLTICQITAETATKFCLLPQGSCSKVPRAP